MFNEKEYLKIYDKYYERIYRYCLSVLDETSAEEVTNDVMITLYEKWDELEKGEAIEHWLFRTARIILIRKRTLLQKDAVRSEMLKSYLGDLIIDEDPIEINVEAELRRIASLLPLKLRMIFLLRSVERLTINQIAEKMGITYSNAYINLRKAQNMAKDIIEKEYR